MTGLGSGDMLIERWTMFGALLSVDDGRALISDGSRFLALDLAEGGAIWAFDPEPGYAGSRRSLGATDGDFVVAARYGTSAQTLVARLSSSTGEPAWSREINAGDRDACRAGDVVAVADGNAVVGLAVSDGAVSWRHPESSGAVVGAGGAVGALIGEELVVLNGDTGEVAARVHIEGYPGIGVVDGRYFELSDATTRHRIIDASGDVIVVADASVEARFFVLNPPDHLQLEAPTLSRVDEHVVWRAALSKRRLLSARSQGAGLSNAVLAVGDDVLACTSAGLFCVDLATGRHRWAVQRHEGFDTVTVIGDHVWANGLGGLAVIDQATGTVLERLDVSHPEYGGAQPVLAGDDTVLVPLADGSLRALLRL